MRIGILTFHNVHNYGAVLQAYGLQEYLKSLGHEAYIIDYRPRYLSDTYKLFSLDRVPRGPLMLRIKFLLRELLAFPIRMSRSLHFRCFIKRYLCLTRFEECGQTYDCFIFGSDQIWNPIISNGIDDVFLGNFAGAKGAKLISYAASVGSLHNLSKIDSDKLIYYARLFEKISCRESELTQFMKENLCREVYTVLDPVLLVGKKAFMELLTQNKKRSPFLLLFTLYVNDHARQVAYKIAELKGWDVVEIVSSQISLFSLNVKHTLSVRHFLSYISSAEFVVTSSFHGTALSILFEKEFCFVPNDRLSAERAVSLMNVLGISERVIGEPSQMIKDRINYNSVNKILEQERKSSESFLSNI